jgi:peroxiredoxin
MVARRHVIAAAAGFGAALLAVGAVIAFTDTRPDVDGEFVLDEPGIYTQPTEVADLTGDPLPDVELVDPDGESVSLQAYSGRPMVINVWYSSCPPCAAELRDFAEVSAEHAGHLQFVGVNPFDDADTMVEFAHERGVEYPLLRDTAREFVVDVPITSFPTTLFVSADGRVVHQTNAIDADGLRAAIAEAF